MVNQQVPGKGGEPGGEGPSSNVIGIEGAVNPDKDVLGEVLGIVRGVGETVTEVVDAAVVEADDLLPCGGIAGQASADQYPCLRFFQTVPPKANTLKTMDQFKGNSRGALGNIPNPPCG